MLPASPRGATADAFRAREYRPQIALPAPLRILNAGTQSQQLAIVGWT